MVDGLAGYTMLAPITIQYSVVSAISFANALTSRLTASRRPSALAFSFSTSWIKARVSLPKASILLSSSSNH